MNYIKGNIKTIIFTADSGFFVGTFKIKETNDETLQEKINKTITVTGLLLDPNLDDSYLLYGEFKKNDRYGYQYAFNEYEKAKIEGKDAVVEFLSSNLIKGCGEKIAQEIVNTLGENAIDLIKKDKTNLYKVPKMTEKRATKIYESLLAYSLIDDTLIELKKMGFSIKEATKIVQKYQDKTLMFSKENLYFFKDLVAFEKLDKIFLKTNDEYSPKRIEAIIIKAMEQISETSGDIYYYEEEIKTNIKQNFHLFLDDEQLKNALLTLEKKDIIRKRKEKLFLSAYDDAELQIAKSLKAIYQKQEKLLKNFDRNLQNLENEFAVIYNEEQKQAIYNALHNPITIISGGPGTGKTTIIKAITKLFIYYYDLSPININSTIALLAPTGRAAKKLSLTTNLKAQTIHRFLKWNKETNDFGINENNKNPHHLIIVDECSMVDTNLFNSLLKGLEDDIQLILVGDMFQLPSVGAGLILNDLVSSSLFSFCKLETIYRQSENSYIPYLAKEIKEKKLSDSWQEKKDDYNFIKTDAHLIKNTIIQVCQKYLDKGIKESDIQILAPMYKGENGIDNLNVILQSLFNPKEEGKNEFTYFDVTYREKDKVLVLQNNPDCNIYNGDIGIITSINKNSIMKKGPEIIIDFDGNKVIFTKENLNTIKHAYAISIHKAQGSEFSHVIMPICKNYYKMLYNKLLYTGVSRAKKTLVIVGEEPAFIMSVLNDYATNRKTDLLTKLRNNFKN